MSAIDWSQAPEAVGALVTKPRNVHHPKTVFAAEFFIFGCMIKGTDCNGNAFSAVDDCWDWVPRPVAPWTGEGKPPVGTICEFNGFNPEETLPTDPRVGDRVTVIAHFKSGTIDVAAFTFQPPVDYECLQVAQGAYGCFRPIRTPEQIEEEEIQDIEIWLDTNIEELGSIARTLHKSGFRKPEAK